MTKVEDDDPPVAGRSSLEEPMARSKWSRRGRRMRIVLLTAWKLVAFVATIFRSVRWVFENL